MQNNAIMKDRGMKRHTYRKQKTTGRNKSYISNYINNKWIKFSNQRAEIGMMGFKNEPTLCCLGNSLDLKTQIGWK